MTRYRILTLLIASALMLAGCTTPDEAETPTPGTPTPGDPVEPGPDGAITVNESFDESLGAWTMMWDLGDAMGDDSNATSNGNATGDNQTSPADERATGFNITVSQERARTGAGSLRLAFDEGNGTLWVYRAIALEQATGYDVNMSVWVWTGNLTGDNLTGDGVGGALGNETRHDGAHVILFAGWTIPQNVTHFDPATAGANHSVERAALYGPAGQGSQGGLGNATAGDGWSEFTLEWATPVQDGGMFYVAVGIMLDETMMQELSTLQGESSYEFFLDDVSITLTPKDDGAMA